MHPFRTPPLLAGAAALLALVPAPAMAQNLASDTRCLIVSNLFAGSKDAKARQAGIQTRYFYLGRLTGSPAQIEAALLTQGKTLNAKNAPQTMQACARAVVQKASELQAIGQRLRGAPAGR